MKNSMQVMCATLTSMEVAEMVEKSHQDLMKSIRRYSRYIEEANYSLDAVKNDGISEQNNLGEGNFALTSGKLNLISSILIHLKRNRLIYVNFGQKVAISINGTERNPATISPRKAANSLHTSVPVRKELYSPPGI